MKVMSRLKIIQYLWILTRGGLDTMKKLKKKGILVIILVAILCISGIISVSLLKQEKKDNQVSLVKIDFPAYGGELPSVVFEDEINYSEISNETLNDEYLKLERKKDDQVVNKLILMLGFENVEKEIVEDYEFMQKDRAQMKIYNDGTVLYTNSDRGMEEIPFSDEECIEMAKLVLIDNDIISNNYQCGGVGYYLYGSMDDLGNEKKIAKTVRFEHAIDDIDIYGTTPVFITFDSEGEIIELYVSSGRITEKVECNSDITVEKAVERAINYEGMIDVPDECDKVILKEIEMVYWEDSSIGSENDTIQPIYKIMGTAYKDNVEVGNFIAYESALY